MLAMLEPVIVTFIAGVLLCTVVYISRWVSSVLIIFLVGFDEYSEHEDNLAAVQYWTNYIAAEYPALDDQEYACKAAAEQRVKDFWHRYRWHKRCAYTLGTTLTVASFAGMYFLWCECLPWPL